MPAVRLHRDPRDHLYGRCQGPSSLLSLNLCEIDCVSCKSDYSMQSSDDKILRGPSPDRLFLIAEEIEIVLVDLLV
jgi:hypothetical protein